jgi:cobalamin biosynthesis protein CobW
LKHVSVDILTGFLGSGKTTLLCHVLAGGLGNERVAVVMNEIGEIGIDGRVVTGLDYVENMVELNSGCICCTIDDYRFDLAIQELVETVDPTLVIIESTGLADPEPLAYRVHQAGLALDAVITVVDAAHVDRALAETRVARAQIRAADFLVVNKVDLVEAPALDAVRKRLRGINRRALLLDCERGVVTADVLFAPSVRKRRQAVSAPSEGEGPGHLDEDAIGSFVFRSSLPFDQRRFERLLDALPRNVYRAKGLVRFTGNPWSAVFNFTCGRWELNWVKLGQSAGETQAVFIGRDLAPLAPRIVEQLRACEVGRESR